jgi:hypothetical protein
MLNKLQYKKIFVTIRKYLKLFFIPKDEFDKQYYENRVRDAADEILTMPLSKRFEHIDAVRTKVLSKIIAERDSLAVKLNDLNKVIDNESFGKL